MGIAIKDLSFFSYNFRERPLIIGKQVGSRKALHQKKVGYSCV
jgi:hypothetical protein